MSGKLQGTFWYPDLPVNGSVRRPSSLFWDDRGAEHSFDDFMAVRRDLPPKGRGLVPAAPGTSFHCYSLPLKLPIGGAASLFAPSVEQKEAILTKKLNNFPLCSPLIGLARCSGLASVDRAERKRAIASEKDNRVGDSKTKTRRETKDGFFIRAINGVTAVRGEVLGLLRVHKSKVTGVNEWKGEEKRRKL